MQVYTYHAGEQSEQRVAQLFNAIAHPEVCPGAEPKKEGGKPEASAVK
jgi:hypothetical protein